MSVQNARTLPGAQALKNQPVASIQIQGVMGSSGVAVGAPQQPPVAAPAQAVVNSGAMKSSATTQVVNGMSVALSGIKRVDDTVLADLCFQLPSAADWQLFSYPDDVILATGGQQFTMAAAHLIDWQTSASGVKTHRCDELTFSVPASVDLSAATLTVKRLITTVPESTDCAALQSSLSRAATGIVIKCSRSDYGMSIDGVQKPSAISDDVVNRLVVDAGKDTVAGPWVFQTSVK